MFTNQSLNETLTKLSKIGLVAGLALTSVIFAPNSFAQVRSGGQDGGGGKGILCRNPDFTETLYLADTFDYVRAGGLSRFKPVEDDSAVIATAELADLIQPEKVYDHPLFQGQKVSLGWMMMYKHDAKGREYNSTLPSVEDDFIDPAGLPSGCQKVQLAFTNLHTGILSTNSVLEFHLPWIERGFLNVHELFIAIRNSPGEDTTPIRNAVLRYARNLETNIHQVSPMIRHMLLTGRKPGRTASEERQLAYYADNDCYNFLLSNPRPSEKNTNCRLAMRADEEFRRRVIPSLQRIPNQLQCKTTSVSDGGLRAADPRMFTVVRQNGTGRPPAIAQPSTDVYSIRLSNNGSVTSKAIHFDTESQDRYQNLQLFGSFRFTAEFENSAFRLDGYNPKTQLFMGSLSFGDRSAYRSFSVICDGGPAEIGL